MLQAVTLSVITSPTIPGRDGLVRFLLENSGDERVSFFPKLYWQGVVNGVDHILFIISVPIFTRWKGCLLRESV